MRVTVVEPHNDDAWLSMGGYLSQLLAAGHKVRVLTVLRNSGNAAGESAGLRLFGVEVVASNFYAPAYPKWREGTYFTADRIHAWLAQALDEQSDEVWCPVGLVHPEHILVADAPALARAGRYLELPAGFVKKNRALLPSRLEKWGAKYTVEHSPPGQKALVIKRVYKSQGWLIRFHHKELDLTEETRFRVAP